MEMNESFVRALAILADGEPVSGFSRARLMGSERMDSSAGLFPYLFTLHLWNLSDDGYLALSRCRSVTVKSEDAELVSGQFADSSRVISFQGSVATICFSPGLPLWQAQVSVSVDAGATVRETAAQLLAASGTGKELLTAEGMDAVFSRPQAYHGRAAECIEEALAMAGARACIVPSGLSVVPASGVSVSLALDEEDLLDAPEFPHTGLMLVRTRAAGWTLGKSARVSWEGKEYTGLIRERSFDLDTGDGPWRTELLLELGRNEQ